MSAIDPLAQWVISFPVIRLYDHLPCLPQSLEHFLVEPHDVCMLTVTTMHRFYTMHSLRLNTSNIYAPVYHRWSEKTGQVKTLKNVNFELTHSVYRITVTSQRTSHRAASHRSPALLPEVGDGGLPGIRQACPMVLRRLEETLEPVLRVSQLPVEVFDHQSHPPICPVDNHCQRWSSAWLAGRRAGSSTMREAHPPTPRTDSAASEGSQSGSQPTWARLRRVVQDLGIDGWPLHLLGLLFGITHNGLNILFLMSSGTRVSVKRLRTEPIDVAEKFNRQWRALDEVFQLNLKNLTPGSPVTSQVRSNTKCLTFPCNAYLPQNAENKRISSIWIDMIRVCDKSKHRPYPEVTFSEVKAIWGHEAKLAILVTWCRNTCLWVGFSSRTQRMTLDHRLWHRNRNKINTWNCMVLHPNDLKCSHFSNSKCHKNNVSEGNYLKLATHIL